MFEALDKSKKRSQLEPKTLISLKTTVYSLSLSFLLFCQSNSNTMFSTVLI